ncbi:MAG: DUF559 domain-containing protein [Planctomycetes bacterium]|nr:DUF559 domain-containing protein [Planctomycetota bacterium]
MRENAVQFSRQVLFEFPGTVVVVDFFFPSHGLVVELDGKEHRGKAAVERDRQRDELVARLGIRTLRVSTEQAPHDVCRAVLLALTT